MRNELPGGEVFDSVFLANACRPQQWTNRAGALDRMQHGGAHNCCCAVVWPCCSRRDLGSVCMAAAPPSAPGGVCQGLRRSCAGESGCQSSSRSVRETCFDADVPCQCWGEPSGSFLLLYPLLLLRLWLQVATIHDLIIHPDLQGFGLGSTLLRRLVTQISDEDVWDVGIVTPSHLQPFFHTCSFELDKEDSVPMALRRGWEAEVQQINAPLQANPQLAALLQRATLLDGGGVGGATSS